MAASGDEFLPPRSLNWSCLGPQEEQEKRSLSKHWIKDIMSQL